VGENIRRSLSEVLMRGDVHDPDLNRISVTVCEVRTSPDLKVATVYVSPLGGGAELEAQLIELLAKNAGELRRAVGRALALKYAPQLRFRIDETFDKMDATTALFARDDVKRDLDE
jgi:ribosome-binding factor A